jgi:hypothetical protein
VVAHVVRNHQSMAAAATGTEAKEMAPDDDPGLAWREAYERMRALTADPEALAKPVNGPTGPVPLEQALGSLVSMDTHIPRGTSPGRWGATSASTRAWFTWPSKCSSPWMR